MLADLRTFILADGTVAGLIGNRLYPHKLLQGAPFPAVTYQVISEVRGHKMNGPDGLPATRVQIDCWGRTFASVSAIAAAILAHLDGYRGQLNGSPSTEVQGIFADQQRTMYESEPELHRISRDYIIYHEE